MFFDAFFRVSLFFRHFPGKRQCAVSSVEFLGVM